MASNDAATGSVSFKAYLMQKGHDKPKEVRRFGMDQNEVTSFELLKRKLREIFPNLSSTDFTVSWKDFENDDIIISSNEELLTALTETTDSVRRLYVNTKTVSFPGSFEWKPIEVVVESKPLNAEDAVDSEGNEEDVDIAFTPPGFKRSWHSSLHSHNFKFHPNVYCDGCEKHIFGHRYKCLECSDFDLCHDCESQMLHKEHIMLRIPLPMAFCTKMNNFSKSMRHMMDCLHKIEHRMKKHVRRANYASETLEEVPESCEKGNLGYHCDYLRGTKRCKRDVKEKEKRENNEQRRATRMFGSMSSSAANAGGGCCKATSESTGAAGAAAASATGASAAGASTPGASAPGGMECPFSPGLLSSFLNPQALGSILNQENLNTFKQFFEHMSPVPEQLLQEVAQNLADVRLSDNDAPKAARTAKAAKTENPFNKKASQTDGPAAAAVPSTSAAQQEAQEAQSAQRQSEDATISQNAQPDVTTTGRTSRSSSEEGDAEGWTVVDDAQMTEGAADSGLVYPKLPAVEPTPVPQRAQVPQVPQAPQAPQTPPQASQALQFLQELPYHADPEVNKCLRNLAEMGYDVNQQIIIDLAVEYKGNVSRVLNVLLS